MFSLCRIVKGVIRVRTSSHFDDLSGVDCRERGMARPLRFVHPGAIYHVMARGDGGKDIFIVDEAAGRFSTDSGLPAKAKAGGFMPGC